MNMRQFISVERTDESIFIFARPYILSFLPWLTIGIMLVFGGMFFAIFIPQAFPVILSYNMVFDIYVVMVSAYFLLIIPFFTVGFIDYYYDLLIVTDRRLLDIDQNSLFSRSVNELALEQIEDVAASNNGILRTLFDFGDVTVQSAGTKEKFIFRGVACPRQITDIILDLADQAKQRIERGPRHLFPTGETKAVIENKVYTTVEPLFQLGAMVRPKPSASSPLANPVASPAQPRLEDDLDIVIDDTIPK